MQEANHIENLYALLKTVSDRVQSLEESIILIAEDKRVNKKPFERLTATGYKEFERRIYVNSAACDPEA